AEHISYSVFVGAFDLLFASAIYAGASSMWASCCGLLNEVMGTGAVRGQQPGFGGGAGPFRFAPNAGFSTYPPPSSGGVNVVCKACGQSFSVFRKKHICCDCKKMFCTLCSVMQENLRRCSTCHLLRETGFQRPLLMQLKVKDLRQYLTLRNIPTDTCREKEDLVDLVLYHCDLNTEDYMDTSSIHSSGSQNSSFFTQHLYSMFSGPSQSTSSSSSRGEPNFFCCCFSPIQGRDEISPTATEETQEQAAEISRKRPRASLSDISSIEDIEGLSVRQLKEILARNFVNYSGCCEKWELVEKVNRLYRETAENQKFYVNTSTAAVDEKVKLGNEDNLCRICMDAVIDCVLLECGHMVTCTKCGKRMSECPICRQYVIRAVHVFKS
uniref:RING-type E3 ubiquitin transferase n=1 Tax=Latimeria chalumnae TaxID=7897 RepID=H3BGN3_LATCH